MHLKHEFMLEFMHKFLVPGRRAYGDAHHLWALTFKPASCPPPLPSPIILKLSLDMWEVCATLEYGVRYVVLTAVSAKMMVVCDVTSCGVAVRY